MCKNSTFKKTKKLELLFGMKQLTPPPPHPQLAKFLFFNGNFLFSMEIVCFSGIKVKFYFYWLNVKVKKTNVPSKTNKRDCSFSIKKKNKKYPVKFCIWCSGVEYGQILKVIEHFYFSGDYWDWNPEENQAKKQWVWYMQHKYLFWIIVQQFI